MENPIKMDDLGGTTILGNPHMEKKTQTSPERVPILNEKPNIW